MREVVMETESGIWRAVAHVGRDGAKLPEGSVRWVEWTAVTGVSWGGYWWEI